jgi:hypothetical protein
MEAREVTLRGPARQENGPKGRLAPPELPGRQISPPRAKVAKRESDPRMDALRLDAGAAGLAARPALHRSALRTVFLGPVQEGQPCELQCFSLGAPPAMGNPINREGERVHSERSSVFMLGIE